MSRPRAAPRGRCLMVSPSHTSTAGLDRSIAEAVRFACRARAAGNRPLRANWHNNCCASRRNAQAMAKPRQRGAEEAGRSNVLRVGVASGMLS
jgi:hypothetical protein